MTLVEVFNMSFGRFIALAVAVFAVSLPCPSLAATSHDLTAILAQARAAEGGAAVDRVTALRESGHITIAGIKGAFEQWQDARSSSFSQSVDAGPLSGAQGYDGVSSWNQDWSGLVWIDGGKAGRYDALATAYILNDDFLRPDKRGSVSFVGRKIIGATAYDVIRAIPPHGLPLQLWLDASTHLVARAIFKIGIYTNTTELSDYRTVDDLAIPFHFRSVSDSGNETEATTVFAQANPPDIAAHLTMPHTRPRDYGVAGNVETSVPIQLIDNHVYVSVRLNGKGPFRFAFDTGGSNLLDSGIAKSIALGTKGSLQGGGVGAQTEGFSFAKVARVQVGGAWLDNQYFAVLPIRQGFSVAAGVPIDGLIGFEVLSRFVTTFDYGEMRLHFRMPSSNVSKPAGADAIPFVFNSTIPQVACRLDHIAGDCSVDTGSRVSVSVLTPFSTAHPTLIPANATAPGVDGFGIGGASIGRLGRLQALQLGHTVLPQLIADFSVQRKGYFANPFIAANVGGGVWRRFSVTFDYPHRVMSLQPNAAFRQRDVYDRSGLFLVAPAGQPTVLAARPGTPAARAGLVRGDMLVAIDGKPAASMDLMHIRQVLSGAPGSNVHLTLRNKTGQERSVTLTLRDYV